MSTQIPDAADSNETRDSSGQHRQTRPRQLLSKAARWTKDGTAVTAAGGLLIADAVRTAPQRRLRAGLLALLGGTLVGLGVRQRRSGGSPSGGSRRGTTAGEGERGDEHEVSAEAHSHRVATDMTNTDTNPRGTTGEPDAEGVVDREVEDVAFDEDQSEDEVEARPTLGGDDEDPRIPDDETPGTDGEEVSLSETDMTDELGKVSQPEDEQGYPASEGTDPEPTSPEAPERYDEGAVDNRDSDERIAEAEDEDESSAERDGEADDEQSDEKE